MEKFEMLCILAFNKTFVAEFDGDKSLTLDSIVESLDSATSPAGAVKVLTEFFDLDVEWESCGYGDSAAIAQLNEDASNLNASRRRDRAHSIK